MIRLDLSRYTILFKVENKKTVISIYCPPLTKILFEGEYNSCRCLDNFDDETFSRLMDKVVRYGSLLNECCEFQNELAYIEEKYDKAVDKLERYLQNQN